MTLTGTSLGQRLKAGAAHLLLSLLVAGALAALVFGLWYPGAYRQLSGGRELFLLVVTVDVVLGPLLTAAVWNPAKGWARMRFDLAVIGTLQLVAMGYGLHTVAAVRPIAMVFEVDRLRVLTADDIARAELPEAPAGYRELGWSGPWQLGTRRPQTPAEREDVIFKSLEGLDLGQRPRYWQTWDAARPAVLAAARPMTALLAARPERRGQCEALLREAGLDASTTRYLPVVARGDWVAVLDARGEPVTYLPVDGFL